MERWTTLPVGHIPQQEMESLWKKPQKPDLTAGERTWLEFALALARWQRRFDIEVGEVPRRIQIGEFDIELEG